MSANKLLENANREELLEEIRLLGIAFNEEFDAKKAIFEQHELLKDALIAAIEAHQNGGRMSAIEIANEKACKALLAAGIDLNTLFNLDLMPISAEEYADACSDNLTTMRSGY